MQRIINTSFFAKSIVAAFMVFAKFFFLAKFQEKVCEMRTKIMHEIIHFTKILILLIDESQTLDFTDRFPLFLFIGLSPVFKYRTIPVLIYRTIPCFYK